MVNVEQSPHLESSWKSNDIVTRIQSCKGLNVVRMNTRKISKLVDKEMRKKAGEEEKADNLHERILKHYIGLLQSNLEEAFDISGMKAMKDLFSLDSDVPPNEERILSSFGVENAEILHSCYGNPATDISKAAPLRLNYHSLAWEISKN